MHLHAYVLKNAFSVAHPLFLMAQVMLLITRAVSLLGMEDIYGHV